MTAVPARSLREAIKKGAGAAGAVGRPTRSAGGKGVKGANPVSDRAGKRVWGFPAFKQAGIESRSRREWMTDCFLWSGGNDAP